MMKSDYREWGYNTSRVICNPVSADDIENISALYCSETVMQMIAPPCEVENARVIAERCVNVTAANTQDCFWSLTLKDDNRWVGVMGLLQQKTDNTIAEMGIMLSPDISVKGVATEVISGMLPIAFIKMGYEEIFSEYRNDHIAIQTIANKLGFVVSEPKREEDRGVKSACKLEKSAWFLKNS